jgi:hypothetical protein
MRPLRERVSELGVKLSKILAPDPERLRGEYAESTASIAHHQKEIAFQQAKIDALEPHTDQNFIPVASRKRDRDWHSARLSEEIRRQSRLVRTGKKIGANWALAHRDEPIS